MHLLLVYWFILAGLTEESTKTPEVNALSSESRIMNEAEHCLGRSTWQKIRQRIGSTEQSSVFALADLSQPSENQRFYVIETGTGRILLQTWVAHGRNTGERIALHFSNTPSSFMSSPGLYRIGESFISPKHGTALLLDGLDKGINDNARSREIIIHGADYVSESFIEEHGRCGRSHGCPALPREEMNKVVELLPPGSLLYIYN